MSKTSYDAWVQNQERPNEKHSRGGGFGFHKPSFLREIPQHILDAGIKNNLSKSKKQTMEAKPICVVYLPIMHSGEKMPWKMCNDMTRDFEERKPDYHWFFIPSDEEKIEFKVFYEKDFTPIKYEELKQLIQKEIEKQ